MFKSRCTQLPRIIRKFSSTSSKHNPNLSQKIPPTNPAPKLSNTVDNLLKVALGGVTLSLGYYLYQSLQYDPIKIKDEKEALEKEEKRLEMLNSIQAYEPLKRSQVENLLTSNSISIDYEDANLDVNLLACNEPIEDRHHFSKLDNNRFIIGVFDGHSGYQCSDAVSKLLPGRLTEAITPLLDEIKDNKSINLVNVKLNHLKSVIQKTFQDLDKYLLYDSWSSKPVNKLEKKDIEAAVSGSCALVAFVDLEQNHLLVANTGDCRAVLGRLDNNGRWKSIPLSEDQTCKNPKEFERILKQHPGEESTVIVRNRVLGRLMPSRAFGDSRYKWDKELQDQLIPKHFPHKNIQIKGYATPPYVEATPEVHYHRLDRRHDQFIVLATDGLYDELTSQQVVELVGEHIANPPVRNNSNQELGQVRQKKEGHEVYNFKDSNLATHLLRNALGDTKVKSMERYKNSEPILTRLAIPAPKARWFRDDITVLVLRFKPEQ